MKPILTLYSIGLILILTSVARADEKNYLAVSGDTLKSAPCVTTAPPTTDSMKAWLGQRFNGQRRASKVIWGANMANQPQELLDLFEELVTAKTDLPDNPLTQKTLNLSRCSHVFCGMQQVWGLEAAWRILYLRAKFGLNVSSYATKSAVVKEWTVAELDEVIQTLEDLPAHFFPIEKGSPRYFFRRKDSRGTIEASAGLGVFDSWAREKSVWTRRAILSHEFGHILSHNVLDKAPQWVDFGKWKKSGSGDGEKWTSGSKDRIISFYGETNPAEDFAESFIAYRYLTGPLKGRAPERYEFMKWYMFGGYKYTTPDLCSKPKSPAEEWAGDFVAEAQKRDFTDPFPAQVKACQSAWDLFLNTLFRKRKISARDLSQCIAGSLAGKLFEKWLVERLKKTEGFATVDGELLAKTQILSRVSFPTFEWPSLNKVTQEFLVRWLAKSMERYFSGQLLTVKNRDSVCPKQTLAEIEFLGAAESAKDDLRGVVLDHKGEFNAFAAEVCERMKSGTGAFPPKLAEITEFFKTW